MSGDRHKNRLSLPHKSNKLILISDSSSSDDGTDQPEIVQSDDLTETSKVDVVDPDTKSSSTQEERDSETSTLDSRTMEDETCGHVSDSGSIEADTVRKPEIGHQGDDDAISTMDSSTLSGKDCLPVSQDIGSSGSESETVSGRKRGFSPQGVDETGPVSKSVRLLDSSLLSAKDRSFAMCLPSTSGDNTMNVLSERADKQCTYCFTLFKTTAQLRAHPCTNWTRGVGDEKFQCAKCAKTFFDEECFGEHEQTCEFDRRPQCTKCSQTFRSESLLTQHKELCTFGDSP